MEKEGRRLLKMVLAQDSIDLGCTTVAGTFSFRVLFDRREGENGIVCVVGSKLGQVQSVRYKGTLRAGGSMLARRVAAGLLYVVNEAPV